MQPIHISIPANSPAGTSSQWVRLDQWTVGDVNVQIIVNGTVNYTLQQTFDDPNDPVAPIDSANVVWFDSSDANVVNASTNQQAQVYPPPVFARILLNSGNGSLRATFVQTGNVTY